MIVFVLYLICSQHKIIGVCDACFKETNPSEIEEVLNGIVSMLALVSTNSHLS